MKRLAVVVLLFAAFSAVVVFAVPVLRGEDPTVKQSLTVEPPLHEHPTVVAMHAEAIRQREAAGIKSHYEIDEQCCQWAQAWANEMARMGSMVHSSNAYQKGEIIAAGYATVPQSISAWRQSSAHWAWMSGNHDFAGWGFQRSASGGCYWVGCFRSKPRPAAAVVQAVANVTQQFTSGRRGLFGRRR